MSLAIIIPAYKDVFLSKTLEFIANQVDKDFTVYIGDDNSPYDLSSIVKQYKDRIKIEYTRFTENLGGQNLVEQWERCVALSAKEEWIWLFSDDDLMDSQCVETFKKELNEKKRYDLYRFDVKVIDRTGKVIGEANCPEIMNSLFLYKSKVSGRLGCYVVEYIFSRKVYEEKGGFVSFDLAWGSDLATWVKYGLEKGIRTLPDACIYWRSSGENISTNHSLEIVNRKLEALISFFKWGSLFFEKYGMNISFINDIGFIKRIAFFSKYMPIRTYAHFVYRYSNNQIHYFLLLPFSLGWLLLKKISLLIKR